MSVLSLRLPDSLHNEVKKLAKRENVSINHIATLAIAEKLAALETPEYLLKRATRADKNAFLRALAKAPDKKPVPADRIEP